MEVLDPGHNYRVDIYDNYAKDLDRIEIIFMKREGDSYPGNKGTWPGTNCQELIRVLIDRIKYLDNQIPCDENKYILTDLRRALCNFETRAAIRHKFAENEINFKTENIENEPHCLTCGHILCHGHK